MTTSGLLGRADRSHLYLLASRLFVAEVDVELYRILTGPDLEPVLGQMDWADARGLTLERAIQEMAVEFSRLFVGPRPVCPPYASVQRDEALVGGRSARLLEQFMEARNLRLDTMRDLPVLAADHLGVELALLAELYGCSTAGTAADDEDPMASVRILLLDHVLPWAPDYLVNLADCATLPLYYGLASLASALLEEERVLHSIDCFRGRYENPSCGGR